MKSNSTPKTDKIIQLYFKDYFSLYDIKDINKVYISKKDNKFIKLFKFSVCLYRQYYFNIKYNDNQIQSFKINFEVRNFIKEKISIINKLIVKQINSKECENINDEIFRNVS